MKIKLAQATWVEIGNKKHGPGEVIEVDDNAGKGMIISGSAIEVTEEVTGNVNTKSRSSGKD